MLKTILELNLDFNFDIKNNSYLDFILKTMFEFNVNFNIKNYP